MPSKSKASARAAAQRGDDDDAQKDNIRIGDEEVKFDLSQNLLKSSDELGNQQSVLDVNGNPTGLGGLMPIGTKNLDGKFEKNFLTDFLSFVKKYYGKLTLVELWRVRFDKLAKQRISKADFCDTVRNLGYPDVNGLFKCIVKVRLEKAAAERRDDEYGNVDNFSDDDGDDLLESTSGI